MNASYSIHGSVAQKCVKYFEINCSSVSEVGLLEVIRQISTCFTIAVVTRDHYSDRWIWSLLPPQLSHVCIKYQWENFSSFIAVIIGALIYMGRPRVP